MEKHSYQQDLKSFNLNLSREPGNGDELTMFNHGDLMSYSHHAGELSVFNTAGIEVIDMEGNTHALDDFKDLDQKDVLIEAMKKHRTYQFMCYPDIPAGVMEALYYYAEGHNSLQNRLPLWKIARSGVKNGKVAQVMCRLLDYGVVAPDLILIDEAHIDRWAELHDKVCALSGLEKGSLIYEGVSEQANELLQKEALSLRG